MKTFDEFKAELAKLCDPAGALLPPHVATLARWMRLRSVMLWLSDFDVLTPADGPPPENSAMLTLSAETGFFQWAKAASFDEAVTNLLTVAGARGLERLLLRGDRRGPGGSTEAELLQQLDGFLRHATERHVDGTHIAGLHKYCTKNEPGMAVYAPHRAFKVRLGSYVEVQATQREDGGATIDGERVGTNKTVGVLARIWLHVWPPDEGTRVVAWYEGGRP